MEAVEQDAAASAFISRERKWEFNALAHLCNLTWSICPWGAPIVSGVDMHKPCCWSEKFQGQKHREGVPPRRRPGDVNWQGEEVVTALAS